MWCKKVTSFAQNVYSLLIENLPSMLPAMFFNGEVDHYMVLVASPLIIEICYGLQDLSTYSYVKVHSNEYQLVPSWIAL